MTDKTWKATERQIAKRLGDKRVPVSGRGRGDQPDIAHPWLAIEVKCRRELPGWLLDAMRQAEASRRGDQLGIVVLHQLGQAYADAPVVIRLDDFQDWHGDGRPVPCHVRAGQV